MSDDEERNTKTRRRTRRHDEEHASEDDSPESLLQVAPPKFIRSATGVGWPSGKPAPALRGRASSILTAFSSTTTRSSDDQDRGDESRPADRGTSRQTTSRIRTESSAPAVPRRRHSCTIDSRKPGPRPCEPRTRSPWPPYTYLSVSSSSGEGTRIIMSLLRVVASRSSRLRVDSLRGIYRPASSASVSVL